MESNEYPDVLSRRSNKRVSSNIRVRHVSPCESDLAAVVMPSLGPAMPHFRRIARKILGIGIIVKAAAPGNCDLLRQSESIAETLKAKVIPTNVKIAAAQKTTIVVEKVLFLTGEAGSIESPAARVTKASAAGKVKSPKTVAEETVRPFETAAKETKKTDYMQCAKEEASPEPVENLQEGEYTLAPWVPHGYFVSFWEGLAPKGSKVETSDPNALMSRQNFIHEYLTTMNDVARKLILPFKEKNPKIEEPLALVKRALQFLRKTNSRQESQPPADALRSCAVLDVLMLLIQYANLTEPIQNWLNNILRPRKIKTITITDWNSGKGLEDMFRSFKILSWDITKGTACEFIPDWDSATAQKDLKQKPADKQELQLTVADGEVIETWLKNAYKLWPEGEKFRFRQELNKAVHQIYNDYVHPHLDELRKSMAKKKTESSDLTAETVLELIETSDLPIKREVPKVVFRTSIQKPPQITIPDHVRKFHIFASAALYTYQNKLDHQESISQFKTLADFVRFYLGPVRPRAAQRKSK